MGAVIAHRGPDDSGDFSDSEAGIGLTHRRLSILDLSERGRQPMSLPDAGLWISYNGEIYNFPELKRSLEGEGVTFRSQTDTEVLLVLYAKLGVEMLDKLNNKDFFYIIMLLSVIFNQMIWFLLIMAVGTNTYWVVHKIAHR